MTDRTAYYIDQHRRLHRNPKRFPGFSTGRHIPAIRQLVEEYKATSLLDYGCGKGYQYLAKRIHEQWGGLLPYCYDPGVTHLDHKPVGLYDGVLCVDVLEHVAEEGVPCLLDELLSYAHRFVFVTIATYPAGKTLPDGSNAHVTVRDGAWWGKQLCEAELRAAKRQSTKSVPAAPIYVVYDDRITEDLP